MILLSHLPQGFVAITGFPQAPLREVPPTLLFNLEPNSSWTPTQYSAASAVSMANGLADRAVLLLHRAASISAEAGEHKDAAGHWLSFCRSLIAMASANPPYPLAADEATMQRLAGDAFSHAAREFHQQSFFCKPANAEEHAACRTARAISRDVLAQLIVHCDDADGKLWDRKHAARTARQPQTAVCTPAPPSLV